MASTIRFWLLGVQIAEDLGPIAGQEDAEERVAVLGLEVLDQLGDSRRVLVLDEVAQSAATSPPWISSRRSGTRSGFRTAPSSIAGVLRRSRVIADHVLCRA